MGPDSRVALRAGSTFVAAVFGLVAATAGVAADCPAIPGALPLLRPGVALLLGHAPGFLFTPS